MRGRQRLPLTHCRSRICTSARPGGFPRRQSLRGWLGRARRGSRFASRPTMRHGAGEPAAPSQAGSLVLSGRPYEVVPLGDYAYAAADSGLQIIDISNPAAPFSVGSYDTPGTARDLVVSGGVAYVADNNTGLQAIAVIPTEIEVTYDYCVYAYKGGFVSSGLLDMGRVPEDVGAVPVTELTTKLQPSGFGYFGCSVDIDGDFAIVGAEREGGGSVHIFERGIDGTWGEVYALTPGSQYFGASVAICGDAAVVGANQGEIVTPNH